MHFFFQLHVELNQIRYKKKGVSIQIWTQTRGQLNFKHQQSSLTSFLLSARSSLLKLKVAALGLESGLIELIICLALRTITPNLNSGSQRETGHYLNPSYDACNRPVCTLMCNRFNFPWSRCWRFNFLNSWFFYSAQQDKHNKGWCHTTCRLAICKKLSGTLYALEVILHCSFQNSKKSKGKTQTPHRNSNLML